MIDIIIAILVIILIYGLGYTMSKINEKEEE